MSDPLAHYRKSADWHSGRLDGLGGSDANILAEGDADKINDLWLLKTRRKKPDELISLPVFLGIVTEDLNRHWYSYTTGRSVWGYGDSIVHPEHDWMRSSLDGITTSSNGREAYWEAKCVNAFSKMPALIKKYKPQCTHVMMCGGWQVSVLSVIIGNKHFINEIEYDPWYAMDLFDLEQEFWDCVVANKEPVANIFRGVK